MIGLIGYPLKHSISPYFQQAALDYYQLDIRYQLWETRPEELPSAVARLRSRDVVGANVTVPHKEAVLPLLDGVDEIASLIGAVNTIAKQDSKLLGYNTDAHGFIQALKQDGQFNPQAKRAIILGAGGAARAVSFALIQEAIGSLVIINRTPERARALVETLLTYLHSSPQRSEASVSVTAMAWEAVSSRETFRGCHLIVNCTTMGMKHSAEEGKSPLTQDVIPEGALVYDLVYNPSPTPLLEVARKAGARILGGLSMLVYQGAGSFELWTGKRAPVYMMLNKAKEALEKTA